jgi:hypothetical protein
MSEIKKQYEITREGKDDMELEIKKTRELLDYFDIII